MDAAGQATGSFGCKNDVDADFQFKLRQCDGHSAYYSSLE